MAKVSLITSVLIDGHPMQFSNTYIKLGESFYDANTPTPVSKPKLLLWNQRLANELLIPQTLQDDNEQLSQYFSGNALFEGSEPLSAAYAGHQFGQFNPQLGDGRAHLIGELIDASGQRRDLQLKGSGTSAFSRSGDGRCAIGPAVREFIMSEAMYALGVPTTQVLAVTTTGESVYRQTAHPGAVVARVASSHVRVGNFQYFAARGDRKSLLKLRDYCIEKHFPEILDIENDDEIENNRNLLLLDKAIDRQIKLICEWLRVGFIHGVMNTDNTAISGETIDFGPCAMMGNYDPSKVFSSIDHQGRYAFGNQAPIAQWNMARFAEALLLLCEDESEDEQQEPQVNEQLLDGIRNLISGFADRFETAFANTMRDKLGLLDTKDEDSLLIQKMLKALQQYELDYTQTFHMLTRSFNNESIQEQLKDQLKEVYTLWYQRVIEQPNSVTEIQTVMARANPVVIPRNHHIEAVLKDCEENNDIGSVLALLEVLRNPYQETELTQQYQDNDKNYDGFYQTFCGT